MQESSALTPNMKQMSLDERNLTSTSDKLMMVILHRIRDSRAQMEKIAVDIEAMKGLKNGLLAEISKLPEGNVKLILLREVGGLSISPRGD